MNDLCVGNISDNLKWKYCLIMVNFVSLFYSHYTAVPFEDGVKDICTHTILGSWVISSCECWFERKTLYGGTEGSESSYSSDKWQYWKSHTSLSMIFMGPNYVIWQIYTGI